MPVEGAAAERPARSAPRRISVHGASGSGKSTLASQLAGIEGIDHVELDALFHQQGWTRLPADEFRAEVARVVAGDAWVIDGNYREVRDLIWDRVELVLYLDLPRWRIMTRLVRRTLQRGFSGAELWNGNREHLANLVSRDEQVNIILWSWRSIPQHRQHAATIGAEPVTAIVLRSPDAVDALLDRARRGELRATMDEMSERATGFPDRRWGRSDTRVARAGQWLVSTSFGSWLVRTLVPVDRWVLTRSRGRFTALGPFGSPLLLLTTTGAKSGLARTTPLVYLLDGDRLLLAGSNFGQERHPSWSTNLLAHPEATVTIGGVSYPVIASLLEGDERDRAWGAFEEAARPYRSYVARTDRRIRVFALRRADEEG